MSEPSSTPVVINTTGGEAAACHLTFTSVSRIRRCKRVDAEKTDPGAFEAQVRGFAAGI